MPPLQRRGFGLVRKVAMRADIRYQLFDLPE
jgi:hypothetical protein